MALNIKKSFTLNSNEIPTKNSSTNESFINDPFKKLIDEIENSWKDKNKSLDEGEKELLKMIENENINFLPDSLKNKSLITYIDAPWGSGKTYFIENFIKYIHNDGNGIEVDFSFNNKEGKEKIEIDLIDAWEIYNGSNINSVLGSIFNRNINSKELLKKYKKIKLEWNGNKLRNRAVQIMRLTESATELSKYIFPTTSIIVNKTSKSIKNLNEKKISKIDNIMSKVIDESNIITLALTDIIEEKFKSKNKFVVIDNIERLSTENRLDVINKVMNWANFGGTTYIFLTNFDKIKITKEFEEDFWNKISLHATFKLENSWNDYIKEYKYNKFKMKDHNELSEFICEVIPLFFSSNSDNMDIREIKKLLDNWLVNDENDLETIDYIKQFLKLAEANLKGLDKYFLLNNSISLLSEKYWKLFESIFEEKFKDYTEPFESDNEDDFKYNSPIFQNKMLRIQSNFFELELELDDEKNVRLIKDKFNIYGEDKKEFKNFNNFIDESSTDKFIDLIRGISETRTIRYEENYLKALLKYAPDMNKYFEFKTNNLKKIFIYNEIKKEN